MHRIIDFLNVLDNMKCEYRFVGDSRAEVSGFSAYSEYVEGTATWAGKKAKPRDHQEMTLLVTAPESKLTAQNMIYAPDPRKAFFTITNEYAEIRNRSRNESRNNSRSESNKIGAGTLLSGEVQIGAGTFLSDEVRIGADVSIGCNCVLDGEITVGSGTVIWDNITIVNRVSIGENCEIQSGTRIGHDGFGYFEEGKAKTMIRHNGGVTIDDDVFIGANCIVCRGALNNDTAIGRGTKIDGLCYIAHNVKIGSNVGISGATALGGSVVIEDGAYIGSAKIKDGLRIGKNAFVGYGSVVILDVKDGKKVFGNPAKTWSIE